MPLKALPTYKVPLFRVLKILWVQKDVEGINIINYLRTVYKLLNELHFALYMVLFTCDQHNVGDVPYEAIQV